MKKKSPKSMLCPACGHGHLEYRARAGRVFEYKGFEYPIPAEMKLVECDSCLELALTPAEISEIEAPIAELHRGRMTSLVDGALQRLEARMTIGEIERALHLSQGYLARARTKGEPSFPLAALLYLLAEHPKTIVELKRLAG